MFIGHWAPALAAAGHRKAPRPWVLFLAAQLVDVAFFTFVLLGVEDMRIEPGATVMNPMDLYHMPYTHSLLGTLGWAAALAVLVWLALRDRFSAMLVGAVAVSHWLLDLLVHRRDLTLAGSPPKLGLGLWNHPWVEIPLELGITGAALWWYARRTRGPRLPLVALAVLLLAMQAVNWLGEQPAAMSAELPVTALIAYAVAIAVAWWLGTSRRMREAEG